MRSIGEILEIIKENKGLKTDADLAKLFKVKSHTVSTWRKRGTIPYESIVAMCEREEIDLTWLLLGEERAVYKGEAEACYMTTAGLKSRSEIVETLKVPEERFEEWLSNNEFALIPQVRGEISAGGGLVPDETIEMSVAFRRDWISRKGDPRKMSLIRVSGDSMEPTLYSGDLVLVDHNRTQVEAAGGIYAMVLDQEILIKRLEVDFQTKRLHIISDNPRYRTQEVDPAQVVVNGKVLWFGRELER